MDKDILESALADDEPRVEETAEQPEQPEAEPQEPEQPASEEQPQAEQQPTLETPVLDAKPEPGFVPIAAMLDERDKRVAAAQRAEQLEAQIRAAQQAPHVPDMFEQPEAYQQFISQQIEERLYGERLHMSERLARIEHGADEFAKAKEWGVKRCDEDPHFNARVRSSNDPYGVVMEEYRREQRASIPQSEFEQFQAWKAAQAQAAQPQQAAPPAAAPQQQSRPRPSLASAPSQGAGSAKGGESILDAALRD